MTDFITGKVWSLDSTDGLVTVNPVTIHSINITWNTASAGSVVLTTAVEASDASEDILMAQTIALASGNRGQITQQFSLGDQTFQGLKKELTVGITSIHVITGNQK